MTSHFDTVALVTFTRALAMPGGGFGRCMPGATLLGLTDAVGSASGGDVEKFSRPGRASWPGPARGLQRAAPAP